MFREGLALMIDSHIAMQVAAGVSTAREAFAILNDGSPDVAIVGGGVTGQLPSSTVRDLRGAWPDLHVILLVSDPSDAGISAALRAEVDGVVTTSESFQAVALAVDTVRARRRHRTPVVVGCRANPRSLGSGTPHLTAREFEVLSHLATGRTVKETAAAMKLAAATVDNHKTRIMRKVDVHNSVQLTRYAIREGIVAA